ncbi:kelch motif family protein, putative [Ichthyophthirius multifiliis]|uniref:Kelch motif family protein, putative n=1 Tax=Ichthyophthirius multifiliis TaxID=5932 RepID=G0R6A1_ICHMU|nr:kelch motif family protein, putative [Ichthyophthirius multifiliis]EGR27009.1 kelch motif family protein, putative [Ichthyophthirius multifiliis]|eukprot:XP_004023893.1 kelch motif family protein, putative [Ichthyophthirius multifiliis]
MIDKYMYLIGGYIEDKNYDESTKSQMYRLDCETYEWEKISINSQNNPEHRDSHIISLIDGKIYMFGGKTANQKLKNDLWCFDPQKNEWRQIEASGNNPYPREGHQGCTLDDRYLIIFGGLNSQDEDNMLIYNDMHMFDSIQNTWKQVTNKHGAIIEARESFSFVNVNGLLYIFGGQGKNVGEIDIFFNDLYKIKFNVFNDGKNESVDIMQICINQDERKPIARASHSTTVYKDRYIFIIGGEGERYSAETESKFLQDIWAFDTLNNFWIEVASKKHRYAQFNPIISHSTEAYKDQIILFGGQTVINIENDNDQVPNENNQQEQIQQISQIQQQQLKQQIQIDEEIQKGNQNEQQQQSIMLKIRQPYISLSFLNAISNLINYPFAAFGLLVDNALYRKSQQIKINLMYLKKRDVYNNIYNKQQIQKDELIQQQYQQKVNGILLNQSIDKNVIENFELFFQIYDDSEGFNQYEFVDMLYKFDIHQQIQYPKTQKELQQADIQEQLKIQYGNNIKFAGLRLGQSVLFISKNKSNSILNVGLISSNIKINPNLQELIIFVYSYDVKKKQYLTENGDQNKRTILNNIAFLMNEEQLIKHDRGNYIYIFDLKRIPSKNGYNYEFSYNQQKNDITLKKKTQFKEKKEQVERLIDFSLKSYIQHLFFERPENLHFTLNDQNVNFICYSDVLRRQKDRRFLKEINVESYQRIKDTGKAILYEQANYNQDSTIENQSQNDLLDIKGITIFFFFFFF